MQLQETTLVLDKSKCLANIEFMVQKASRKDVNLRPHFKTHYAAKIAAWFKMNGVNSCTVSSVEMAEYFALEGWDDITIAIPFNILQIDRIEKLAERIRLNVLVDNLETLAFLETNIKNEVGVFIKIDTGYRRAGISSDNLPDIELLIRKTVIAENLIFRGYLSHFGHTYKAKSKEEINEIYKTGIGKLVSLKTYFNDYSYHTEISIGDTPGTMLVEDWTGITEIRPGNFVFFDLMQVQIGSCNYRNIAVALATPVIGIYPERNRVLVHAGAIHLSKETLYLNGIQIYGLPVWLSNKGWLEPIPDCFLTGISQEHGILEVSIDFLQKIKIGDIIGILPIHSCLTAHLMRKYVTLENEHIETFLEN